MIMAFSGFALIGAIVLVGWAVRRWAGLPENAEAVFGRLVYLVLAPCLLFTGVATADLHLLFSEPLIISTAAAFACFGLFAVVVRRLDRGATILGAMASGYTNANYIGIPVATYVLGDATLVVPIVMLQLLFLAPVTLALLEVVTTGHASWRAAMAGPLRNPLIVAVLLGMVVSVTGITLPAVIADPIDTIGQAAVPVVLITFGMSLSGTRVLGPGPERFATVVAVVLKTVAMPLVAFLLAVTVGLSRDETYAVTVLAALPTAQNVFLHAQRFNAGLILIRDTILLSTICCVPVMLLLAVVFAR
ncbi:AEC family transporter [Winogradskya humida]|nr:AEC family transporter [Actinoplanes humidus]